MVRTGPFDRHVDRYEEWFERNQAAYQAELRAIASLLGECEDSLEVGVGTGRFALPLGIRQGVDPSPVMAQVALQRGIEVKLGQAESLPYPDQSFDCLLMVTTICFVDNLDQALREAYRVLRPAGRIVVGFVDRDSELGRHYQAHREENPFYREATFYSTDEVVEALRQAGFEDFHIVQTLFGPPDQITDDEPVRPGYGKGSFVVISAVRPVKPGAPPPGFN